MIMNMPSGPNGCWIDSRVLTLAESIADSSEAICSDEPQRQLFATALQALAGAGFERADQTVDKGLRRALVGHRIEQPTKRRPGEVGAYPCIVAEHILQAALLGNGLAGCRLDDFLRLPRVDLARE